MKIFIPLFLITGLAITCSEKKLDEFNFLVGIWKTENKDIYESWEVKDQIFAGEVYKIVDGQKVILEKIEIKYENDLFYYTPTVFDQNNGKPIPFILNKKEINGYSFENSKHDFPKKIQYKVVSENELFISVLGEYDQGFSYKLFRQNKE